MPKITSPSVWISGNRWLVGFVDINVPLFPYLELYATHYPHLISRVWIFIYKIKLTMNTSSQTLTLISQRCLMHVIYPYPLLIIRRSKNLWRNTKVNSSLPEEPSLN
uniref:Uncharacterized protein n=1 Tax=Lepeophtheirus salmonis TaxID=72036 RepID=A0A0K2UT25_LEPSM